MSPGDPARLSRQAVTELIGEHFPQIADAGHELVIESVGHSRAVLRLKGGESIARPGGTVSGPAMFMLADVGLYVAILGTLGEGDLQSVTTNLNISFLSRPALSDMIASVHLLKIGRRLIVGEVEISSDGAPDIVAHAVGTYARPEQRAKTSD